MDSTLINPPRATPPTAQEYHHLTSLVPLSSAFVPPCTVPEILATVFKLCRDRWVADFLFSEDMTPLSALTAPVNLSHSIACTVTMTAAERDVGLPRCAEAPCNPFDMHMHGDYIFVPAFSVGSISVGFGVHHCDMTTHGDWGLCKKVSSAPNHFRYVRDDANGVLINVRPDGPERYKVDYMAHETARRRRRVFLTVAKDTIQNMLATESNGLDPARLVNAIGIVQSSDEFRDCPFCGTRKDESCDCKLYMESPKHPLDFNNMIINMSSHLGSFEGVTSARLCTDGMELISARLGSRITIDCEVDSDLLERLSTWAISDQLKNVKADPVRAIMPAAHGEMKDMGRGAGSGFTSGEATDAEVGGESGDQEIDSMMGIDAMDEVITMPLKDTACGVIPMVGLESDPGLQGAALDALRAQQPFAQVSLTSECTEDLQLTDQIAREAQLAYQAENAVSGNEFSSGTSSTPSGGANGYAMQRDSFLTEEERVKQEKERKAELRRQRNREAAQRSNARRKEKNDTLKAALREVHSKAAELREREMVLREENIELRKKLSS